MEGVFLELFLSLQKPQVEVSALSMSSLGQHFSCFKTARHFLGGLDLKLKKCPVKAAEEARAEILLRESGSHVKIINTV